jgi:GMP synthase-like glutamine amidotransferase
MTRAIASVLIFVLLGLVSVGTAWCGDDDAWRAVFATSEDLAAVDEPVVCILTIQHPDIIRKQLADKPVEEYSGMTLRDRMQQQSGLRCVVVHFTEVRGEDLDRGVVKAILITGRSRVVSRELDAQFYPLIRETSIPIFGFCGGMQMIGQAYSATVGPLRKLREGERDPNPNYHPGQFKEWGYLPVQIIQRDPLFEGLPDEIVVRQAHAFQVMQVPEGFELLASSPDCKIQAFKHRQRLVYGTQFHPEVNDDQHPHGRVVVDNFFRLVGLGSPAPSAGR